jgi:hypothetical protein
LPDGRTRTGRELKGDFTSAAAGVNRIGFGDLRGVRAVGFPSAWK